jgi:hypothetical protein
MPPDFDALDNPGVALRSSRFRIVSVNKVCDSMDDYKTQKTNDSS